MEMFKKDIELFLKKSVKISGQFIWLDLTFCLLFTGLKSGKSFVIFWQIIYMKIFRDIRDVAWRTDRNKEKGKSISETFGHGHRNLWQDIFLFMFMGWYIDKAIFIIFR